MDFSGVRRAGRQSSAAVLDLVNTELTRIIEVHGVETVAGETTVSRGQIAAIQQGAECGLTVADAAAILGVAETDGDGAVRRLDFRDTLLVWMSEAVLDVEDLAAELGDTDPTALRDRIDGREPFSLQEYASVVAIVETERA